MTDPTYTIRVGGLKTILPATARVVVLSKVVSSLYMSLEEGGVDYIVPTGKKLWILKLKYSATVATCVQTPYKHTVADVTGGTLIAQLNSGAANTELSIDCFISVEAGKYINITTVNLGSYVTAECIELDV